MNIEHMHKLFILCIEKFTIQRTDEQNIADMLRKFIWIYMTRFVEKFVVWCHYLVAWCLIYINFGDDFGMIRLFLRLPKSLLLTHPRICKLYYISYCCCGGIENVARWRHYRNIIFYSSHSIVRLDYFGFFFVSLKTQSSHLSEG